MVYNRKRKAAPSGSEATTTRAAPYMSFIDKTLKGLPDVGGDGLPRQRRAPPQRALLNNTGRRGSSAGTAHPPLRRGGWSAAPHDRPRAARAGDGPGRGRRSPVA